MNYPSVTFTMTCGRRYDFFLRTMASFLENCLDQDLIVEWLVGADRATPQELADMRAAYPFLQIYESRPGHAANLNDLFARVQTEWAVHWEDDWELTHPSHCIRELLAIAADNPRHRNVILRDYHGAWIKSGELVYKCHVNCLPYRPELEMPYRDNLVAPGFSLNPGLQHLPTLREAGGFSEQAEPRLFESDMWWQHFAVKGYIRANIGVPCLRHIGEQATVYPGEWNSLYP